MKRRICDEKKNSLFLSCPYPYPSPLPLRLRGGGGAETFIKADEAAAAMLDMIGEAAGEPCGAGLYDCKAASRLELIREGEVKSSGTR